VLQHQSATNAMALDLLSSLAHSVDEEEAIEAMLDTYLMLFAPQRVYYLNYLDGKPDRLWARPPVADGGELERVRERMVRAKTDQGPVGDHRGFLVQSIRQGETKGLVAVEEIAFPEYFDAYLNLALAIKDICDLPIENARRFQKLVRTEEMLRKANEKLGRLVTTDGLTGIANRRSFDQHLEVEWKRAKRNRLPLSLVMIDIDHFKRYNDRWGHPQGDHCLHKVARTIRKVLARPSDFAARYGGEEFVVMLPATDSEGAHHVAEKIRQAVGGLEIPHQDSPVSPWVTLSLGVATSASPVDPERSPADLLRQADTALYQAKAQGRNQTVTLPPPSGFPEVAGSPSPHV
jgi:diguanylate cyclase (GGDEF)-like protein